MGTLRPRVRLRRIAGECLYSGWLCGYRKRTVGGLVDKVEVSDLDGMSDEQAYVAAVEAAVKLLGALGVPQENLNELNAMIEKARAVGFAEDQAEADDKAPVPATTYHAKPSARSLNGDVGRGR